MGFELSEKRSYLHLLMSPGPIVTLVGLVIILVSVFVFGDAAPDNAGVDAILESQANSGQKLKSMVGLVIGTIVSVGGVLLSLLTFSRR